MFSLEKFFIFALLLELTLAASVPLANEKSLNLSQIRYSFFDHVLTYTNEMSRDELFHRVKKHHLILEEYNNWLSTNKDNLEYNKESYEQLKDDLEWIIRNYENLKKDPTNCEIQRKFQDDYFSLNKKLAKLQNTELNKIWMKYKNTGGIESFVELDESLTKFFLDLNVIVAEFLKSSHDDDKHDEEHRTLVAWCNKFTSAQDRTAQIEAFIEFKTLFDEELEREMKTDNPNCKLQAQIEWFAHMEEEAANGSYKLFT